MESQLYCHKIMAVRGTGLLLVGGKIIAKKNKRYFQVNDNHFLLKLSETKERKHQSKDIRTAWKLEQ